MTGNIPPARPEITGPVHGIAIDDGRGGVDVAPARAGGLPAVALWTGGDDDDPCLVPAAAIPALIEALASAALDAMSA